jgi:hypothetical protein
MATRPFPTLQLLRRETVPALAGARSTVSGPDLADHQLSDPGIGARHAIPGMRPLRSGWHQSTAALADIDKRSFDGERNIVAWADVVGKNTTRKVHHRVVYLFESYRRLNASSTSAAARESR